MPAVGIVIVTYNSEAEIGPFGHRGKLGVGIAHLPRPVGSHAKLSRGAIR